MEVEIDPETGEIEVTHVVNVNDVGKVISPESCAGQQYGGTYMGCGGERCLKKSSMIRPLASC